MNGLLRVLGTVLVALATGVLVLLQLTTAGHAYDGTRTTSVVGESDDTSEPMHRVALKRTAIWEGPRTGYDDRAQLAGASARSGVDGLAPRAIGPAGNPGALSAPQRAQYLFDNWHSATFPNRTQSINYHLAKHGNGRSAFEYTQDAQQFFSQNRNLATEVILKDGTPGLRVQTKVPLPGGGTNNVGGYWTSDGRLVTFWD